MYLHNMKQKLKCAVVVQAMEIYSLMTFMPGQNCVIESLGGDSSWGCGGFGCFTLHCLRTVDTSEVPAGNPTLVFHSCCFLEAELTPMAVVTQWVILNSRPAGLAALNGLLGSCLLTAHFRSMSENSLVSVLPGRLYGKETTNAYCQNLASE